MTIEPTNPQSPKTLARSDDRMIAGVCSGVAEYFGIDTTLVRVVTVLAVLLGFGAGLLIYIAGWLIMPDRSGHTVITWRPSQPNQPVAPAAPTTPAAPAAPTTLVEPPAPATPPATPAAPTAQPSHGDDAPEPPRSS
jgi:phage shock protein C